MTSDTYLTVIATVDGAREKFKLAMTHAKCILDNGEAVELRVGPAQDPIGIQQRKFFHGVVLKQISEQAMVPVFDSHGTPTGQTTRYVIKTWKRFFKERFLGWKWTHERGFVQDRETGAWRPAKKATPRKELISTETLGTRRYSKLIDDVIDHAIVELGVQFEFDPTEREAVRYGPRGRTTQ